MNVTLMRIYLIARATVSEGLRRRVWGTTLAVALIFSTAAWSLSDFPLGASELHFVNHLGLGVIAVFGAMVTAMIAIQSLQDEFYRGTADLLWIRGVSRAEFVIGKWLGVIILSGLFCGVIGGLTVVLNCARTRTFIDGASMEWWPGLLSQVFLGWLKLTVLAALALWMASVFRQALGAVTATFLLFGAFHAGFVVDRLAATHSGFAGVVLSALSWGLPNLQRFHAAPESDRSSALAGPMVIAVVYVVAFTILAVVSLRRREN